MRIRLANRALVPLAMLAATLCACGANGTDPGDTVDPGPGDLAAEVDGPGEVVADGGLDAVPGDGSADAEADAPAGCESDGECAARAGSPCRTGYCEPQRKVCLFVDVPDGTACDTGSLCETGGTCWAGACRVEAVTCTDGNPCTDDLCDPASGCFFRNGDGACDDGNACTTGEACADGACVGGTNACACTVDGDCAAKEDGDACNGTLVCTGNACVVDPATVKTCAPPAGNPCARATCDPATGACGTAPRAEGAPCDDGDRCSLGDACQSGLCVGNGTLACEDGNPCSDDSCDPADGCRFVPNALACDDGNGCTTDDTCQGGVCLGQSTAQCGCRADADCEGLDNGNRCDGTLACRNGSCVVDIQTIVLCERPADAVCRRAECDPATGACTLPPLGDGRPCDDDDPCTTASECQSGECVGTAQASCDDGLPCTADSCGEAGCEHAPLTGTSCDDANACTTVDTCNAGTCAGAAPVACTAADPCHAAGTCDPATGLCSHPNAPDGTGCDDGNACTTVDACATGTCVGGAPVACTAADACHVAGTCDPATGLCSNPDAQDGSGCNDGNPCTTVDACATGTCVGSAPVACAAQDACHLAGTCDPATGLCSNPTAGDGTGCEDGNPCTTLDTCAAGTCVAGTPVACTPLDACHVAGTCDPATGLCSHPDAEDGTGCDDGSLCTTVDACAAGTCVGSAPVACAALDACHVAGTCDPATGLCSNPDAQDGTGCDDGNACTTTDTCLAGDCAPGAPVTCTPLDDCHVAGACDPATGLCGNPDAGDGTGCEKEICRLGETCVAGACQGGTWDRCDDGNPDTADECLGGEGCLHHPNGETCAAALPIEATGTQVLAGTTAGRRGDLPPSCGGGTGDVVYVFELSERTAVLADLATAAYPFNESSLELQAQPCDEGSAIACAKQFYSGAPPRIGEVLPAGTWYLVVRNAAWETQDNGYTLTVTFGNPCLVLDCDDGNTCTVDGCDEGAGQCSHAPGQDGLPCADDPCATGQDCLAGACRGGEAVDCDDQDALTVDLCDRAHGGCYHVPVNDTCAGALEIPVDFEVFLTGTTRNAAADYPSCGSEGLPDVVYTFTLDARMGVLADLSPLDPYAEFQGALELRASPCETGTVVGCNDGGSVPPSLQAALDPGTYHLVVRVGGANAGGYGLSLVFTDPCSALDCDDGNPCTRDGCDPESGRCLSLPLSDGVPCKVDACRFGQSCLDGACQGGEGVDCDDGEILTIDTCDPVLGCRNTPVNDRCEGALPVGDAPGSYAIHGVVADARADYEHGCELPVLPDVVYTFTLDAPAGLRASAVPATFPFGVLTMELVTGACDEGATTLQCLVQWEEQSPLWMEAALPAGTYFLRIGTGWEPPPTFDLSVEFVDPCALMDCDDLNPCTDDSCDPAGPACVAVPLGDGAECDLDRCVAGETCQAGQCAGGTPVACDDGLVDTFDWCDPATGCMTEPWAETCRSAMEIPVDTHVIVQGSLAGYAGDALDMGCGFGLTFPEAFFTFTVEARTGFVGALRSTAETTQTYTELFLQEAPCGQGPQVGCSLAFLEGLPAVLQATLEPGTYFLMARVAADPSAADPYGFELDLRFTNPCDTMDCNDGNDCTLDACDPDLAQCTHLPLDGTPCNGGPCLHQTACVLGTCTGAAIDCDDQDPQTVDECDPATGCVHRPANDGCADAIALVPQDGMVTVGTTALAAFDVKPPCGIGFPASDVVYTFTLPQRSAVRIVARPASFPDSLAQLLVQELPCGEGAPVACATSILGSEPATATLVAEAGRTYVVVVGAVNLNAQGEPFTLEWSLGNPCLALDCTDDDPCTVDGCDESLGECVHVPAPEGFPCDAGACVLDATCTGGTCAGADLVCDDGDPMTADLCDPATGCRFPPVNDTCEGAVEVVPEGVQFFQGSVGGAALDYPQRSQCNPYGAVIADAVFRFTLQTTTGVKGTLRGLGPDTYGFLALARGDCLYGTSLACEPLFPGPSGGEFQDVLLPGTYHVFLGVLDLATQSGGYEATFEFGDPCSVISCEDDNPCTEDSCDPFSLDCLNDPVPDGSSCATDPCLEGQQCSQAACGGGVPRDCDEGDPATFDWCEPGVGCLHVLRGEDCLAPIPVDLSGGFALLEGSTEGFVDNDPYRGCAYLWGVPDILYGFTLAARSGLEAEVLLPFGEDAAAELLLQAEPCLDGPVLACAGKGAGSLETPPRLALVLEPGAYVLRIRAATPYIAPWTDYQVRLSLKNPCDLLDCDDGTECTTDGCDREAGLCTHDPANERQYCVGDPCMPEGNCVAGRCEGTPTDCSDGRDDTVDGCDPASGCWHRPVNDQCEGAIDLPSTGHLVVDGTLAGAQADYYHTACGGVPWEEVVYRVVLEQETGVRLVLEGPDDPWTSGALSIVGGDCASAPVLKCFARNPGLAATPWFGVLPPGTWYFHVRAGGQMTGNRDFRLTADLGDPCTGIDCNDGNPCTDDTCVPETLRCDHAPTLAGTPCEADPCLVEQQCADGRCEGGAPRDCGDGDDLTYDWCEPGEGCRHIRWGENCLAPLPLEVLPGTQQVAGDTGPYADDTGFSGCGGGVTAGQADVFYTFDLVARAGVVAEFQPPPGNGVAELMLRSDPCSPEGQNLACSAGSPWLGPMAPLVATLDPGRYHLVARYHDFDGGNTQYTMLLSFLDPCDTLDCDDGNSCTADSCDRTIGQCVHVPTGEDGPCADDPCRTGQWCASGVCQGGEPADCDDQDPLTEDLCGTAMGGCYHVPVNDRCEGAVVIDPASPQVFAQSLANAATDYPNTVCGPGNDGEVVYKVDLQERSGYRLTLFGPEDPWTWSSVSIVAGDCASGLVKDCHHHWVGDPVASFAGILDAGTWYLHVRSEGWNQSNRQILFVTEFGSPCLAVDCDDGNPCTQDTCDPETLKCTSAPAEDSTPCSAGGPCVSGQACQAGQCTGGEPTFCDDGDDGTGDWCDPVLGCQAGLWSDRCESAIPLFPDEGVTQRLEGTTEGLAVDYPNTMCGYFSGLADAVYSFGVEARTHLTARLASPSGEGTIAELVLQSAGCGDSWPYALCAAKPPRFVEPAGFSTMLEPGVYTMLVRARDEATGAGDYVLEVTFDNPCGDPVAGIPPILSCDDGVECTTDTCDTGLRACVNAPDPSREGTACTADACTEQATCQAGTCIGTPLACSDGDPQTDDLCDPATGCWFPPLNDRCGAPVMVPAEGTWSLSGTTVGARSDYSWLDCWGSTLPDVVYGFSVDAPTGVRARLASPDGSYLQGTLDLVGEDCASGWIEACMLFEDGGLPTGPTGAVDGDLVRVVQPGAWFLHVRATGDGSTGRDFRLDVEFGPLTSH